MKVHYNPKLKDRSRELRKNAIYTERFLWKHIRAGQLNGYKFLRQKPLNEYIVDFYCKEVKLVIEIDGVTHNDKERYDKPREKRLKELGFNVLRFNEHYIIENTNEALESIMACIKEIENKTSPWPPSKGELDFAFS